MTPEELAKKAANQTFAQAGRNIDALATLEKLEAEGTIRPAEQAALNALRSKSEVDKTARGQTGATYRGALQGATFNQADEIGGLIGMDKAGIRERNAEAERQYPDQYRDGKIAGGTATGILTAPIGGQYIKGGEGLKGLIGRSGLVGALEGSIWGAGEGEGWNKIGTGARGAAIGGLLGMAAPPAVALGVKGAAGLTDLIGGALNVGNKSRAQKAIAEALGRSGKTPQGIDAALSTAAREGQPEMRLADAMGVAGQRLTNSLVRGGGDSAEEIAQYLRQRQLDQGDRMAGFVEDAFGYSGQRGPSSSTDLIPEGYQFRETPGEVLRGRQVSAQQTTAALKGARGRTADEAYDAARDGAAPVDVRGAVDVIDARIGGMQGVDIAGDSIDAKLAGFKNRLFTKTDDGQIELSDFDRVLGVKQDVSDAIGAAVRAGRNNEARELTNLRDALDAALENASSAYRKANDDFAAASRVIGAVDEGVQMARPGARAADTTKRFSKMSPEEQAAARVGYGDRALAKIESNAAPTADKSRPFRSTKAQTESETMAIDPALFGRRVQREGDMWETQNRALGGSRTADNLQDIKNTGALGNIIRAMRSVGNLQVGDAAQNLAAAITPAFTGRNEATTSLIAKALLSADAKGVVEPAAQRLARQRLIEMLLQGGVRGGGREAIR